VSRNVRIGNQAVLRRKCAACSEEEKRQPVQPRLAIGPVDDPLEREADRVADRVMRMTDGPPRVTGSTRRISRACAACQRDEGIQREASGGGDPAAADRAAAAVGRGGVPLPLALREFFEPRFGQDFSSIRLHTGSATADAAAAIGARAYTLGSAIGFASGAYQPVSEAGRRLIAHELVHVVQQAQGAPVGTLRRVHTDPATGRQAFDCPDYVGDPKLEACLNDEDRLRPGDRGETVAKVQRGLLSDGEDLGPTGADGSYGSNTAQAVMAFKKKYSLGFEQFPDVGPGTMAKLDALCAQPGPTPPIPPAPSPVPPGPTPPTPSECPRAPTGLGNIQPDPSCARADYAGTTELARWLFCFDSDQIATETQLDKELNKIVADQPASTRFLVNGNASIEGEADYNFRLACHRANRIFAALAGAIRRILQARGADDDRINAEIQARIEVGTRGATSEFAGGLPANRVAVLYGQIPGGEVPEEPSCKDAPRNLGDITPEVNCDPPTMDLTGMSGSDQLRHFHFCLQSDVLTGVDSSAIASFAHQQAASVTFVVHGFTNAEGKAEERSAKAAKNLSCHRALRIARELMNAGVQSGQIREVSGLGSIDKFGGPDFNQVAIVLAEGGEISPIEENLPKPENYAQKLAIRDAARSRLLAGQYQLAADAYLSFWTCGRTPTLRQAVERLTIDVPDYTEEEVPRDKANGMEEGRGANSVVLSNTALRADNPIECTTGRIIDMAFHQAVIGEADLSPDLASMPVRHAAGLHLIALAGLSACKGRNARARNLGHGPAGIDEPLTDDPRADIPPPACARPSQPTRLLPPSKGEKERQRPDFFVYGSAHIDPREGNLITGDLRDANPRFFKTSGDVIKASANVGCIGTPDVFPDYEVGFIQTVIDDLTLAEYISGHRVVQKLPVPIRAAHMKGEIPVPQPWMALDAMAQPDASGFVSLNTAWRMDTPFAPFFNFFRSSHGLDFLDTLQRHTSLALWLVARRRAAPLDRFSVVPIIDGVVYDVTQNLDVTYRRLRGDLDIDPKFSLGETEFFLFGGKFRTSEIRETPPAFQAAQFDVPVASDIDLIRQTVSVLDAPPAPQGGGLLGGMSGPEYGQTIKQILDNLEVFTSEEDLRQGVNAVKMPRLGFIYAEFDIEIGVDRITGRILPSDVDPSDEKYPVKVKSKGLQINALRQLSWALDLRLSKRDFLGQGKSAVLNRQALDKLPVDKDTVKFAVKLPPLADVPDYGIDDEVTDDMAEMFVCTEVTEHLLDSREFGAVYWVDRDKNVHRLPDDKFKMSGHQTIDGWQTDLPCDPNLHKAGLNIGTVHTHPEDSDPNPSPGDKVLASGGVCGRRHYVVSKFGVIEFNQDGTSHFRQDITNAVKPKAKTADCKQVKSENDLD
jgi:outer membrane protein OmpA-like peptidoglycan-associated protein